LSWRRRLILVALFTVTINQAHHQTRSYPYIVAKYALLAAASFERKRKMSGIVHPLSMQLLRVVCAESSE
jgi:hypothetical protein